MQIIQNLTRNDVLRELQKRMQGHSVRSLAFEMQVSASYLYDVIRGKRDPGPSILTYLNLEKNAVTTVVYKRVKR